MNMTTMILTKTEIIEATCPETVMLRNIPKMCSGNNGIMTFAMSKETMLRNSAAAMMNVNKR